MQIRHFFLIPFLFYTTCVSAQFEIGWNGGYANPQELNREIYVYNAINSTGNGLKKEMPAVHWYQGLVVGFESPGDFFGELKAVRRSCMVSSEFDSAGVAMKRQLKVQANTLNLGCGY